LFDFQLLNNVEVTLSASTHLTETCNMYNKEIQVVY